MTTPMQTNKLSPKFFQISLIHAFYQYFLPIFTSIIGFVQCILTKMAIRWVAACLFAVMDAIAKLTSKFHMNHEPIYTHNLITKFAS